MRLCSLDFLFSFYIAVHFKMNISRTGNTQTNELFDSVATNPIHNITVRHCTIYDVHFI